MKKLSVLVLALVLVVSLASVSMAATTTYGGEVGVQLSNGITSTSSQSANFVIDYTKTYNDQLSAGLTVKYDSANTVALDLTTDPAKPVTKAPLLPFDTTGWIKFNYSPLVVTVKTSAGGNVADALGVNGDMVSGAGAQVEYTVMEGATVTAVVNAPVFQECNYLVKGVYSANGLKVGAGYQAGTSEAADAMAFYGSLALGPITVGAEYANRMFAESTGILGTLAATFGPLSANAKVLNISADGFACLAAGDAAGLSAYDAFKVAGDKGTAIGADATYKVTDALSVNGNFQMVLDGAMSYLGGATYKLSDALSVAASYKALNYTEEQLDADATLANGSQVNVTLTDTFAAGLVGTLSLDMDLAAETQSYTAKVVATL